MSGGAVPALAACFNRSYVPHVATMLRSYAGSASRSGRWYLAADDSVDGETMGRLLEFVRGYGVTADVLHIPDELVAGFETAATAKYPRVAWYRAVLAEALAGEDRLLYLDSDLLVLHDLEPLWETELGEEHLFGAVCHPSYGLARSECIRLGLAPDAPLLNSGVMVMDLAKMRSQDFAGQIREWVVSSDKPQLRYADQDAMNVLFSGRWTRLDPVWNCLNDVLLPFVAGATWADDIHHEEPVLERAARSPAVVHFDGASVLRPWHRRCFNPFAGLYRQYRATTPWPIRELDGDRYDVVLSRIPPRVQAKVWRLQYRRAAKKRS